MRNPAQSLMRIVAGATASSALWLDGIGHFGIYVPALGTATTIKLQATYDGTTWGDMYDSTPAILRYASSSGGFWLDGDYCARFAAAVAVRVVLGATQAADVDCRAVTVRP